MTPPWWCCRWWWRSSRPMAACARSWPVRGASTWRECGRLRGRRVRHALHRDVRHASGTARAGGRTTTSRGCGVAQMLSLVVSLFCFVIAAGFLLSLVPDPPARRRRGRTRWPPLGRKRRSRAISPADASPPPRARAAADAARRHGQPTGPHPPRLPVEGADGTHFIDAAELEASAPTPTIKGP